MRKTYIKMNSSWVEMPEGTDAATWLHMGVAVKFITERENG